MTSTESVEANRVIEALGGPSEAGAKLGISKSAVSQWRKNGVPKTQMKYLRVAHPEIFGGEAVVSPPIPARRATDPAPAPGHGGRQPASPHNILDTVPMRAVVTSLPAEGKA